MARPARALERTGPREARFDPSSGSDLDALLELAAAGSDRPLEGVVYALPGVAGALRAAQAVLRRAGPRLWIVTRGAQP